MTTRYALILPRDDLLLLLAEFLDAERDDVARFEELRRRLHAQAHARRRAGDDDVARLHHHELRAVPDQVFAAEDHGLGVAALALLAIDVEPHLEILRILDLILGDEPRADRPEGLGALALAPLTAGTLDLEVALGHVVRQEIAGDRRLGIFLGQITRALADNDADLDFPVELERILRDDGVVVGADDAALRLVEDDRLFRHRHAGFGGVVRIVQADGDEVTDIADAGAEPRLAGDRLHALQIGLLDLGEAAGGEHGAVDVLHDARQVADFAIVADDTGLFAAGRAVTDELHEIFLGTFVLKSGIEVRRAEYATAEGRGAREERVLGRRDSSPVFLAAPGRPYSKFASFTALAKRGRAERRGPNDPAAS